MTELIFQGTISAMRKRAKALRKNDIARRIRVQNAAIKAGTKEVCPTAVSAEVNRRADLLLLAPLSLQVGSGLPSLRRG